MMLESFIFNLRRFVAQIVGSHRSETRRVTCAPRHFAAAEASAARVLLYIGGPCVLLTTPRRDRDAPDVLKPQGRNSRKPRV